MAENILDLVSDVDLTIFSREIPEPGENPLTNILPNRKIDGIYTERATHTLKRFTAQYRAYDAEAPIGQRGDKLVVEQLKLPPVSEKLPVNESLIHELRRNPSSTTIDRLIKRTYDDVENLTVSVHNRVHKARGEFLSTGAISIQENGVVEDVDYGLADTHNTSAPVLWSDPTANIVEDEITWTRLVRKDAKARPTRATMSEAIFFAMLQNEAYREAFWQRTGGPTLNPDQLNQVRGSFQLPPANIFDDEVPDNDGGSVRIIPENLYILTTDSVGETQWGTTAESLELASSNAVDFTADQAPGLAIVQWATPDPVTTWTKAAAVPLPVAGDINGLFVGEVLA